MEIRFYGVGSGGSGLFYQHFTVEYAGLPLRVVQSVSKVWLLDRTLTSGERNSGPERQKAKNDDPL